MNLLRCLRASAAACAVLAICASAASANSTVGPSSSDLAIAGNWTSGNLTLSASTWIWTAPDIVATESGAVTSWSIRTGTATGTVQLMVLHLSGGSWQIAAETTAQPVTVLGVNTYSANLPITAGDTIAVTGDNTQLRAGAGSATSYRWQGHPTTVGTVLGAPELSLGSFRLGFSADITAAATPTVTTATTATTATPTALGLTTGTASGQAGTAVGIDGAGFDGARQVLFGDTPAAFVVDGYNHISAVAPDGPTGTVAVRVLGADGQGGGAQLSYTYPSDPPAATESAIPAPACPRVPSLLRHTLEGALAILARDGCHVALVHTGRGTRPPGRVTSQSAAAGTSLGVGSVLRVALG